MKVVYALLIAALTGFLVIGSPTFFFSIIYLFESLGAIFQGHADKRVMGNLSASCLGITLLVAACWVNIIFIRRFLAKPVGKIDSVDNL